MQIDSIVQLHDGRLKTGRRGFMFQTPVVKRLEFMCKGNLPFRKRERGDFNL
jgi:hypothetical protein